MTSFLLIEQLMITDGTIAPLNRLRIIYAFGAAIALFMFGIGATIIASGRYAANTPDMDYHSKIGLVDDHRGEETSLDAVIAAVIALVGMVVYIAEALARNRKSRII